MNRKIRILGIAPYENMREQMIRIAEDFDEISLKAYVGDLQEGLNIIRQSSMMDYDIVVSRGGTAGLVKKIVDLPVLEIDISLYDILSTIKLAENYTNSFAIVGFAAITEKAYLLCDLMQYDIDIVTIASKEQAYESIKKFLEKGYRTIICDVVTQAAARELGMDSILVTSGNESIKNTFDEAIRIYQYQNSVRKWGEVLTEALRNSVYRTFILNPDGTILFDSENVSDGICDEIIKNAGTLFQNGELTFFKNIEKHLYRIEGKILETEDGKYGVFYVEENKIPIITSKYGMSYHSYVDVYENTEFSFVKCCGYGNMQVTPEKGRSSYPIMILGETGTEKEEVARQIYLSDAYTNNPFIVINCSLLCDKGWNFLVNHYNSPLIDNNNTIFLKNMQDLESKKRVLLLSLITDNKADKRNHMIFSYAYKINEQLSSDVEKYINVLSCSLIKLKPLRERFEDVLKPLGLYLNELNVEAGKHFIGFKEDALRALEAYPWPYNFMQLKRVVREAVKISKGPYISLTDIQSVLANEISDIVLGDEELKSPIVTLDEHTYIYIKQVLKEENGNQCRVAQRLGISRTTLWRYLKRYEK